MYSVRVGVYSAIAFVPRLCRMRNMRGKGTLEQISLGKDVSLNVKLSERKGQVYI